MGYTGTPYSSRTTQERVQGKHQGDQRLSIQNEEVRPTLKGTRDRKAEDINTLGKQAKVTGLAILSFCPSGLLFLSLSALKISQLASNTCVIITQLNPARTRVFLRVTGSVADCPVSPVSLLCLGPPKAIWGPKTNNAIWSERSRSHLPGRINMPHPATRSPRMILGHANDLSPQAAIFGVMPSARGS